MGNQLLTSLLLYTFQWVKTSLSKMRAVTVFPKRGCQMLYTRCSVSAMTWQDSFICWTNIKLPLLLPIKLIESSWLNQKPAWSTQREPYRSYCTVHSSGTRKFRTQNPLLPDPTTLNLSIWSKKKISVSSYQNMYRLICHSQNIETGKYPGIINYGMHK